MFKNFRNLKSFSEEENQNKNNLDKNVNFNNIEDTNQVKMTGMEDLIAKNQTDFSHNFLNINLEREKNSKNYFSLKLKSNKIKLIILFI